MALPIPTEDDGRWPNGEAVRLVMDRELIAVGRFNKQTKSIDPTVVFTGA